MANRGVLSGQGVGDGVMRFCRKCVLPNTRPNLAIGESGVCNACEAHATKDLIDWIERKRLFGEVVRRAKAEASGYDCVIPVSGGKDSTWQVVTCLEYGMTPLAVTWKTPGRTEIGRQNLENLVRLGVDHIDYQISPSVERRFMRLAFERYGSVAIPMHQAIFNIPLTLAVRLRIPLIVWGENSAFEYGGTEEQRTGFQLDEKWLKRYGVTHGTTAADWLSEDLTAKDLTAYFGPSPTEALRAGVRGIFLGYYFPWDPAETAAVAAAHGFCRSPDGPRTGYYDYADIDDVFISVHHWLKWYKFGFTRTFDNLSLEIRNNRLSREEAIDILVGLGDERPTRDIVRCCEYIGLSETKYDQICETFRNTNIWHRESDKWVITNFISKEWIWS